MVQCSRWDHSARDRRPSTRSWQCRLGETHSFMEKCQVLNIWLNWEISIFLECANQFIAVYIEDYKSRYEETHTYHDLCIWLNYSKSLKSLWGDFGWLHMAPLSMSMLRPWYAGNGPQMAFFGRESDDWDISIHRLGPKHMIYPLVI